MNTRQWNTTMFGILLGLAALSIPFFAFAQDLDFGGLSDLEFGGLSDLEFGGLSDLDFGGFSDSAFGGLSDSAFGGLGSKSGPSDSNSVFGGKGASSGSGFDPFDGDLGPFGGVPGNPKGDDTFPNPGTGCVVGCSPGTPPVTPPPIVPPGSNPSGSAGQDELGIFIHRILIPDGSDRQPGSQVPVTMTIENTGNRDLDDTKIILVIPELSVRAAATLDLDSHDKVTRTLLLDLPEDAELRDYAVRLYIAAPQAHRIVHRDIGIIDYS